MANKKRLFQGYRAVVHEGVKPTGGFNRVFLFYVSEQATAWVAMTALGYGCRDYSFSWFNYSSSHGFGPGAIDEPLNTEYIFNPENPGEDKLEGTYFVEDIYPPPPAERIRV